MLSKPLPNKPGIFICDNKNLSRGNSFNLHNDYKEGDNLHINKFAGTGKLAGDLKYVLCSALSIKEASHQNSKGNSRRDTSAARNQNMSFVNMTEIVTAAMQPVQQNQNSGRQETHISKEDLEGADSFKYNYFRSLWFFTIVSLNRKLTVSSRNVHGLFYRLNGQRYCKFNDQEFIGHIKSVIVGFVESKASEADQLSLDGYSLIHKTVRLRESKGIYGGVVLFATFNITKGIEVINNVSTELVWVKLKRSFLIVTKIYICAFVTSPKGVYFF